MTTENTTLPTVSQIAMGLEAQTLRDAFAGEDATISRALSDLFAAHVRIAEEQPQPRLPAIARTEAAIVAEEAQYGVLDGLDRWRMKQVAYAADVGIEVVHHVLRMREINARKGKWRQES